MSVNGVQKCVLLRMYRMLEPNSEDRLKELAGLLGLKNTQNCKSKTELLIRITDFVGAKKNHETVKKRLPKSIVDKLYSDEERRKEAERLEIQKQADFM